MTGSSVFQAHWRARLWAGLAVITLLVMESTLSALWYQSIFAVRWPPWGVVFGGILGILSASYLLPRMMEARHWNIRARQAAAVLWILLAGYASLWLFLLSGERPTFIALLSAPLQFILRGDANAAGFFHMLGIILLVWRGVSLARSPLTLGIVQASFQLGLISILMYGMFYAPLHPREALIGLYLVLFCGLTAMSLSRIANLSETRGGRVPRFGFGWLASILLAGLAVVALAVLAGWASSGQVAELTVRAFIIILGILTALVLLLLSPLLLWMTRLVPLLADLVNQILERFRNLPVFEQAAKILQVINEGLAKLTPYVKAGRGLALAGILLALVIGVILAVYLRRAARELIEEEAAQPTESGFNHLSLQNLLRRIMNDARGLRLRRAEQLWAAARIRQIYRQLMLLSRRLGEPRPPSATPLEFLPRLAGLFPSEQSGLEHITRAYISVRYGKLPETAAEVAEIQAAWERVHRQGRLLAGQKRRSAK